MLTFRTLRASKIGQSLLMPAQEENLTDEKKQKRKVSTSGKARITSE